MWGTSFGKEVPHTPQETHCEEKKQAWSMFRACFLRGCELICEKRLYRKASYTLKKCEAFFACGSG
jgi:hypothetical protein